MTRLVDTNVLRVANDAAADGHAPDCVEACVDLLLSIREVGTLALDEGGAIITEYLQQASPTGMPGVGDAFLQWVLTYQATPPFCVQVRITPNPERRWEEFPDADDLADFDPSDRKFVAVALTHPDNPPVYNATDSDWHKHFDELTGHGLRIVQLCPDRFNS